MVREGQKSEEGADLGAGLMCSHGGVVEGFVLAWGKLCGWCAGMGVMMGEN